MWVYHIEHTVVMVLGFLVGATLAMCIAPGDVFLVLVTGAVLGFFARGFLDQNLGGELLWPFAGAGRKRRGHGNRTVTHR